MPNTFDIGQVGQQAANETLGAAIGLALEGHNDKRQLRQQGKLQDLQIQGQKNMVDYNYQKQLQMWKDTSYGAQKEQMIKAGINPALMYGMSGGGGQTTGTPSGAVSGGEAPKGGHEVVDAMGMSIQAAQLQLLNAQVRKTNAEAKNTEGDAANKPLVGKNIEAGTTKTGMETASLAQGIENQKAQQKYIEAQTSLEEIQVDIQGSEINDMKAAIRYGMRKLYAEMLSSEITQNVDKATQNTKIKQAQADVANTVIDTWLKKAQAKGIDQSIQESVQKVKNMIQENMREWDKMAQTNRALEMQGQKLDYDTAVPPELKEILDNIFVIPNFNIAPKANKIGFK